MPGRLATVYVSLTCAAALVVGAASLQVTYQPVEWAWWGVGLLFAAAVLSEERAVRVRGDTVVVSIATVPHLIAALLLPPALAATLVGAAMLLVMLRLRRSLAHLVFNTSSIAATVGLTGLAAHALGVAGRDLAANGWLEVVLFFAVVLGYHASNTLLVSGVVAISSGDSFLGLVLASLRSSAPAEFAMAVIGGLAAFVWVTNPFWLPVGVFPAVIAQLTLRYLEASSRKSAQLQHQALHDLLTGLPNRALLRERAQQAILASGRQGHSLALLVMDLDRFKEVNDTFGHHYGDLLLQETAQRLRRALRENDTIARLGGDEFSILLPTARAEEATQVAERLLDALRQPVVLEGYQLEVAASIGIALCPDHGLDADGLLQRADVAMYVAKRASTGYAVYSSEQDQHSPARLALVGELRRAIEQDQLMLHYQPQVDPRRGTATAVEALVRWRHPQRGVVPPDQFIPLAEQTGLIRPLTHWVLNAALRQGRAWREAGLRVPVAVNVSMRSLHDPHLPDVIAELLATWDLPATWLSIEVTESHLMADPARAMEVLSRLRALGVRIAIDDFGTGYSSLAYLKRLPVDELKLDKSFVEHLAEDERDRAIVRSTIGLAHDLGLTVVAEGVEDARTWDVLVTLGCDVIQGYYLSRPLPATDLARWLCTSSWSPAHLWQVA